MIGRMLLNYGELEMMLGTALGYALNNQSRTALRVLFRVTGESARLSAADALMRDYYIKNGKGAEYADMLGAFRWCTKLRNQYAHCHWADHHHAGLFFTDLSEPAKANDTFDFWFRHVDLQLLEQQKSFFDYTGDCLTHLDFEGERLHGMRPGHVFPMPSKRKRPSLHNPPEQHIPPWLTEEQKQRHIARAQAQKPSADPPKDKDWIVRFPTT
ncbi:MAG: hypothetical protein AB7E79_13205 [Rhodospirillaceae bacterium]